MEHFYNLENIVTGAVTRRGRDTAATNYDVPVLGILDGFIGTPGSPAGGKTTGTELNGIGIITSDVSSFLTNTDRNNGGTGTTPKAYINYILFDEQFRYVTGSFSRVGTNGSVKSHYNDASMQNINVEKNGYLYVYVSNESPTDVFFDNLQVIHTRGPILEETHYYPFGLTMTGISSKALKLNYAENMYKFNGIEHNSDFDLNIYDAFYRNLDPQIGRFWQIDPKVEGTEAYSPYTSMLNNPIRCADPLGDSAKTKGNEESINKFLKLLGEKTGNTYTLNKKGEIVRKNKDLNKKSSNKVSATLSSLVETIITDESKHIELNFTSSNDGKNPEILFDDFISGTIDVGDLEKVENDEFLAGIIGHTLAEQYSVTKNETKNRGSYNTPHEVAKIVESVIISEMTSTPYGKRTESAPQVGFWKTKVEFQYDQKVYQITTKTNGIIRLDGPTGRVVNAKRIK